MTKCANLPGSRAPWRLRSWMSVNIFGKSSGIFIKKITCKFRGYFPTFAAAFQLDFRWLSPYINEIIRYKDFLGSHKRHFSNVTCRVVSSLSIVFAWRCARLSQLPDNNNHPGYTEPWSDTVICSMLSGESATSMPWLCYRFVRGYFTPASLSV